jgi:MarR family transcriptional regulator for hemolysin
MSRPTAPDELFDKMTPRYADFYPAGTRANLEFRLSRKLILAARHWVNLIDGTLKAATGHNRARWQTLFAIAFAEPPITTVALSARLSVQWPTLVRTLGNLEAEGLISRTENPSDGRSRLIELTPRGREMLDQIQPVLDPTRAEVVADLTDEQLVEMTRLLDLVVGRTLAARRPRRRVSPYGK